MGDPGDKVTRALHFARMAHTGQKRKYTGEPYVHHPGAVMALVAGVDGHTEDMLAAALLHDVLEDTRATYAELMMWFGHVVAQLVEEVSDISEPWMGNRARRKEIDRDHVAKASAAGKTIKLADLIDNTRTIVQHDPDFARVYLREKRALLEVLDDGDPGLLIKAWDQVNAGEEKLGI